MSGLTKTLAAMTLLVPVSAQALGIGDIRLHSSLNQNLNAEIVLTLASGENPSDVSVRLAPPEKFDQAGVPWSYFLSKLRFETIPRADGNMVVKVTSREALTEPFLNFLVEVSWPQGAQTREFTVLIDPPADYTPTQALPSIANGPFDSSSTNDEVSEPPVRRSRHLKQRTARASRKSEAPVSAIPPTSGEYGPTRVAETLWGIAQQLGAERNVPTPQMMNALFHANPEAFNRGNMDSMKAGVVLKIPDVEALQTTASPRKSKAPSQAPASREQKANGKSLELVAPSESKIDETAENGSKPASDSTGSGSGVVSSAGTSPTAPDLALQARIEKLEQQLNMMQELLALKDQQLAVLQNKDQKPQEPVQTPASTTISETPKPDSTASPSDEPAASLPVTTKPAVEPSSAPVTPPKPAVTPAPKPTVVAPPEEESFIDSPLYSLTVGGFGVTLLGALGWLWWRKRKIEAQTDTDSMFASASQIKIPEADSSLSVPVLDMGAASAYDVGTVGESSFISDFTPSDFDAFDTDQNEIDPLSEADVYLAYGRYQQAEDLIRNAIKEQPNKNEYKLKLLEIFYANENRDAFSAFAHDLANEGKQSDPVFWAKVSEMAREIIPNTPLFGGMNVSGTNGTGTTVGEDAHSSGKTSFQLDQEDDLEGLDTATVPDMELMKEVDAELAELGLDSGTDTHAMDDNSLDFDLSALNVSSDDAEPEEDRSNINIESIDFDLSTLSLEPSSKPEPSGAESRKAKIEDTIESFDFNFDLPETRNNDKTDNDKALSLETLESFDFPDFENVTGETEIEAKESRPAADDETALGDSDDFDFNFDFNLPDSNEKSASDEEIDFGVSDLTDMDEFETKIDLAKAYVDMGDSETARKIAEEILKKGNNDQKQAARNLIEELR